MNYKKITNYTFFLISAVILFVPTDHQILVDGLILDKLSEKILLVILIPFFLLIKLKIKQIDYFLIMVLVLIKLILITYPNKQINLTQNLLDKDLHTITNQKDFLNKDFFYNNNNFGKITKNLESSLEFPIEWINYYEPNSAKFFFKSNPKEMPTNYMCRDAQDKIIFDCNPYIDSNIEDYTIKFDLEAYVFIDGLQTLVIEAGNSIDSNISLASQNSIYNIKVVQNINHIDENSLEIIDDGLYKLKGYIIYKGKDLTFRTFLIKDKILVSGFKKGIFFDSKINKFSKYIIFYLSLLYNFLIISYLTLIVLRYLKKTNIYIGLNKFREFYLTLLLFIITYYIIYRYDILSYLPLNKTLNYIFSDYFYLSFYYLIVAIIIYCKKELFFQKESFVYKLFFLNFILIPSLYFFIIFNFDDLEKFSIHNKGIDWHTFQYFAFRIGSLNEFIRAGEDIILFRPLIRYFSYFINFLSGHTFFINKYFDVLMILLSSYLLFKIIFHYTKNIKLSLLSMFVLLCLYFGETFKFLIGKNLSEYPGMFFILLNIFYLLKTEKKNGYIPICIAGMIGVLGTLLREDHIILISSLILIPIVNSIHNSKITILGLIKESLLHYRLIILYISIILIGFVFIYLRNYYVSGFFLYGSENNLTSFHPNAVKLSSYFALNSFYILITGSLVSEVPRTFTILNFFTILIAIYTICTKQKKEITIFSIFLLITILPNLFLNIHGLRPRFTIHLIPITIILGALFFNSVKNKLSKKKDIIMNKT